MEDSSEAAGSMPSSIQASNVSNATAREMILKGEGTKQRRNDWTTLHRGYSQKETELTGFSFMMESIALT